MKHITVLQTEAVDGLALQRDSIVVDATLGAGGHSRLICAQLGEKGVYVGIDADQTAIDHSADIIAGRSDWHLVCANFSTIDTVIRMLNIPAPNAILADLGWHTDQFTDGNRGFSFSDSGPLHMTYGDPATYAFTAVDVVNEWKEVDIANVLYGYGEERYSRRIAAAIVAARKLSPIDNAVTLAHIIAGAVPAGYRHGRIHPATKSFQALRIAVNDEFTVLEDFITRAWNVLAPQGRLAIITFHSHEDRIVKHRFRELTHDQNGHIVTKKPITPTDAELRANPRARSAKLRIIQKQ
jgi:16S rRNA (cytosine1402-N4)-methyltransferase